MKASVGMTGPDEVGEAVLLLGGTGRTGARVLSELVRRGIPVRAIVRSAARLPADVSGGPLLTVIEGDPSSLAPHELRRHLDGCGTVISCLGHNITVGGILGPPFDLVSRTVADLVRAVEAMKPSRAVRLILMSSVSVSRPGRADRRRGSGERAYLSAMRLVLPPARDSQRAADVLARGVGTENDFVEWVVVRPDTLREADAGEYEVSDEIVSSIFRPDETNREAVARFMCDLATNNVLWRRWRGGMPVLVNAASLSRISAGS